MKLWQELRRRRLFRLAGLYIVGAWVAIQVGDTFFPAWGIPETALRYQIIGTVLGFPIAMIFGWFYDITAEGIIRTPDASASGDLSLKRTDFVVLGALALVAIAVVYGSFEKVRETTDDYTASFDKPANSIAVLPFDNLSDDDSNDYFSDGITEEILHQLGTFEMLSVMGRVSSFAFKGADVSIPEMSDILRVRYLLQGSVRRQADRIRVTASLVDERGFQVWTDTFDREMTNVFAIQSDIANSVAGRLVEEIAPREIAAARTTNNIAAYQEYLVGREYVNRRTPGWQESAAASFERAAVASRSLHR